MASLWMERDFGIGSGVGGDNADVGVVEKGLEKTIERRTQI